MCRRVTCKKCNKPTWAGCGAHIEMVLAEVPPQDRCQCPARSTSAPGGLGALLSKLFG